ncbi:MAG: glutamate mutase L [Gammaproteobacteria bacterium]|nr:glutamate mutase L [Gammaproteobacteria bacterium]
MSEHAEKLLVDVGSTYFKVCTPNSIEQHFRDFNKRILDDLMHKCGETLQRFSSDNIHICSSANGGLSTLIIGLTNSYSLKYATNIAYNSGINVIDSIVYQDIDEHSIPSELIDVVIVVGGINSNSGVFDSKLGEFIKKLNYSNVVYVGNTQDAKILESTVDRLVVLPNIIDDRLHIVEQHLREYLTNLYQQDIEGKEDIKHLYELTSNQIFSTPFVVNKSLPLIHTSFAVTDPFILFDIGGATTDVHYSKDLVSDNIVTDQGHDRIVFKKLGVYKSRQSLIFTAENNEYAYELLMHLKVTENIYSEQTEKATKILMQMAIFLVLCQMSNYRPSYVTLKLLSMNSIVFTGGITKVLTTEDIEDVIAFFYRKILNSDHKPATVLDKNYDIWTLGAREQATCQ